MALTRRLNGSTSASLVTSAWWNDYLDYMQGVMPDQLLNPTGTILAGAVATLGPTAPTVAAVAGTGLSVGSYIYSVAFAGPNGVTTPGTTVSVTTTSTNKKVNVSNIAVYSGASAAGVTQRILYRSKVGGTQLFQLAVINDNTTTTFVDTTADTSLTLLPNPWPTLGGAVQVQDASDVVQASMSADGQIWSKNLFRWSNTLATSNRQVIDMAPTDGPRVGLNYNYNGGNGALAIFNYNTSTFLFNLDFTTGVMSTALGTVSVMVSSGQSGRQFVSSTTPGSPQQGDVWFKV